MFGNFHAVMTVANAMRNSNFYDNVTAQEFIHGIVGYLLSLVVTLLILYFYSRTEEEV